MVIRFKAICRKLSPFMRGAEGNLLPERMKSYICVSCAGFSLKGLLSLFKIRSLSMEFRCLTIDIYRFHF